MAVTDITSHLAARNPGTKGDQIAREMQRIDEAILMLGLARDSLTLHEEDCPVIEAIHLIHLRLKRSTDTLLKLL